VIELALDGGNVDGEHCGPDADMPVRRSDQPCADVDATANRKA
jgi:hypothetical protein